MRTETHTLKRPKRWDQPFSAEPCGFGVTGLDDAAIARLLTVEPFEHMDPDRFPAVLPLRSILRNDTRQRQVEAGEVIIRQGDYGTSAFLILMGAVRVVLSGLDPTLLGRRVEQRRSRWRSLWRLLKQAKSPESRDTRRYRKLLEAGRTAGKGAGKAVQGASSNVLEAFPSLFADTDNRRLESGQSFGELGALGRMPRTASVIAEKKSLILEIRWQGLRDLRKYDDALREHLDTQYRQYALVGALSLSPLLVGLSAEDSRSVANAARFHSYGSFDWHGSYQQLRKKELDPLSEEPVIAAEGEVASGLIVIRSGFARVSRRHGNGEQTLTYLDSGQSFGLAEMVHNARHRRKIPLRTTLRAIGYVDIVVIPADVFEMLLLPQIDVKRIPEVNPQDWNDAALSSLAEGVNFSSRGTPGRDRTEFFVEHRFINGTATMLIDLNRCTRCDDCVRACAAGHDNNPRFLRQGAVFGTLMVANACMHCVDPVCMIGCPTGAIHRSPEAGEVVINDQTCIGCGVCASSCPYDNIHVVPVRDGRRGGKLMVDPQRGLPIMKATKCDLCIDHPGGPACARACPHDALSRVAMHDYRPLADWL